ncbi:hypothetical protein IQ264_26970 [Phormidium sp. LEGE 05292]|uniref:hypothetical protein n=1 Tax=[Phormidium] sp. LEGE 05292 TaxID=767427 RepID=UPI00187FC7DD|nr:hypothetical protein [Phormidium sp. LEGE 05292]MBE9229055.1 hypothetical protein [Phormidium sp. LEGE 05292]
MDKILDRSRQLKQNLVEFVLESEGDLAVALESYVAANSHAQNKLYDTTYERKLLIDSFLTEGKVRGQTPIDLFLANQSDLSESDRNLVKKWQNSFLGLFAVQEILPDGFELMNWLTAKHYTVKPNDSRALAQMAKFKNGEILLTRISPINDDYWMFSGPCLPLGNLGKPKLAVAIGNFKDLHKKHLYSDAPDLLEEAWRSVEQYHQDFLDFFGSDEVTMPGYQLNKKFTEFQEVITKKRLAAIGIDDSKSLEEIAKEAGVSQEEIAKTAKELGADSQQISQLFQSQGKPKMMLPKVELPDNIKKAEQVTVIAHPRWGQVILPTYTRFKSFLVTEDWQNIPNGDKLIRKYLEDPEVNVFVWNRLTKEYPTELEKLLQKYLKRPNFKLENDLNAILQKYKKPLEPELSEIASVPIHLHNLFQEAIAEVDKSNSKSKTPKNKTKGFAK